MSIEGEKHFRSTENMIKEQTKGKIYIYIYMIILSRDRYFKRING